MNLDVLYFDIFIDFVHPVEDQAAQKSNNERQGCCIHRLDKLSDKSIHVVECYTSLLSSQARYDLRKN